MRVRRFFASRVWAVALPFLRHIISWFLGPVPTWVYTRAFLFLEARILAGQWTCSTGWATGIACIPWGLPMDHLVNIFLCFFLIVPRPLCLLYTTGSFRHDWSSISEQPVSFRRYLQDVWGKSDSDSSISEIGGTGTQPYSSILTCRLAS